MWLSRLVILLGLLALQVPSADPVSAAFATAAADSPDGSNFAETPGYRELVAALLELKPADVEARRPTPIDVAGVLADPAALHGAWVSAQGYVLLKKSIPFASPIGSVTQVERVIMKLDHDTRIVCDLIGDPPPFKSQADTVRVSGVFFRTVSYENANGATVTLPYMLARSMELIDTPSSSMGKSLIKGGPKLLAGVLLGVLGAVVFVLYLRRSARSDTN